MNKEKIFKDCIEIWGNEKNKEQLIEEAAELIVAIRHYKRGKITKAQLVEEMVDVQMMIDICKDIYNVSENEWKKMFVYKLGIAKFQLRLSTKK